MSRAQDARVIRRSYIDGPHGQLHLRMLDGRGDAPDLICLHPAPFSGLAFAAIMPELAEGRRVIAPDFPGHGGSDPFRADPTIADYAEAMQAVVEQMSPLEPVDLFGFHSGCLAAAELALIAPDAVRRLVLCDVPAFEPAMRAQLLVTNGAPPVLTAALECLAPAWERGITRRIDSQGMERSFAMFVEQLRHGEAMNAGFHAAFEYDLETRLQALAHPTTILATQSGLLDATRRAADLIAGSVLDERLDITRAVLDEAAQPTAGVVKQALA